MIYLKIKNYKIQKFAFILMTIMITGCANNNNMSNLKTRQAAVDGQFYPADASRLEFKIKEYLSAATSTPIENIKAIMVPHAGYDYSGPVAAYAYKAIEGKHYDNVILIGNSHSAYFNGVAIDDSDLWETPLGQVPVNKDLAEKISKESASIELNSKVHEDDHSLEVQVPFLQSVLKGEFKIVPILYGAVYEDGFKDLANALANNLGENDLIVVSSDMSHYPSYENANEIDKKTLENISSRNIENLTEHIESTEAKGISGEETLLCGADGVKTVMEIHNIKKWNGIEILHYANSGDSKIGDKTRVVGYGAVIFTKGESLSAEAANAAKEDRKSKVESFESKVESLKSPAAGQAKVVNESILNNDQKQELLNIARETVESYVLEGKIPDFVITDERLNWKEGAFVTLTSNGELRGCIGQIIPTNDPLWDVVRDMAVAAATQDYRFIPVRPEELKYLDYEISVLSNAEKIADWRDIQLGKHGVIVEKGRNVGVFLPQVATETGWTLEKFMSELCSQKAGLDAESYKNDPSVIIKVFTAQVFEEE